MTITISLLQQIFKTIFFKGQKRKHQKEDAHDSINSDSDDFKRDIENRDNENRDEIENRDENENRDEANDVRDVYCYLCLTKFKDQNKHKETKHHLEKNTALEKLDKNPGELIFHCRICITTCSSEKQLKYHLLRAKHAKALGIYIQLITDIDSQSKFPCVLSKSLSKDFSILCNNLKCFINVLENTSLYDFIDYEFNNNKIMFGHFIKFIRDYYSIKKKIYSDEKIDRSFDKLMESNGLSQEFYAVSTKGDGNCFYRSISYLLFDDEEYYFVIKFCCIYLLFEYKSHFINYFRDTSSGTFENKILYYITSNTYADECSYILTEILINRPILSISCDKVDYRPFKLKYCTLENINEKPIYIGFLNNHMVSILLKDEYSEIPENNSKVTNIIIQKHLGSNELKLNLYDEIDLLCLRC
jgi:hypothetical protein